MKTTTFAEVCTPELQARAIINDEYHGFREDYLVLHCLIKKYLPKTFFEIGTNMGKGTSIICNANPNMKVFSLDLPPEQAHISLQSPGSEGKGAHKIGSLCAFHFTQVLANSLEYDYSQNYPIEGWWIDAEHTYDNVLHESKQALKSNPKIVIWHDTDIPEVMKAVKEIFDKNKKYDLYRVTDTRVSFALLK